MAILTRPQMPSVVVAWLGCNTAGVTMPLPQTHSLPR